MAQYKVLERFWDGYRLFDPEREDHQVIHMPNEWVPTLVVEPLDDEAFAAVEKREEAKRKKLPLASLPIPADPEVDLRKKGRVKSTPQAILEGAGEIEQE